MPVKNLENWETILAIKASSALEKKLAIR